MLGGGIANYTTNLADTGLLSAPIALIGGGHGWTDINYGCYQGHGQSSRIISLTLTEDTSGVLRALVAQETYSSGCWGSEWNVRGYNPSTSSYFPPGSFGREGTFNKAVWGVGSRCDLADLSRASATILQATPIDLSPGTHKRTVTIELTGANASDCAVVSATDAKLR
ncbi:hypothetical protein AXA91_22165 [Salmonella enterica]|nr:hypothetical protein [Salmonella enterica]